MFSFEPRCQGLSGDHRSRMSMPVSMLKLAVLGHLAALIPGDRSDEMLRQRGDLGGHRGAERSRLARSPSLDVKSIT